MAKISHAWRSGLGFLTAVLLAGCAAPVKAPAPDVQDSAAKLEEAFQAYGQGDCHNAIAAFAELARRAEHPMTFNGLGLSYLQCGQPQDAVSPLEQAAVLAPSSSEIRRFTSLIQ
jgi:Flp pilus assembly protein TadD